MVRMPTLLIPLALAASGIAMPATAATTQATGQPANGTTASEPRPVAPPDPDLAAAGRFDCANAGPNPPPVLTREIQRMQPQTIHGAALTTWYGRQFVSAGVWTQAQADSFANTIYERPEMAEGRSWQAATAPRLQDDLAIVMRESEARNYPGACRALMTMLERVSTLSARFRSQWAIIDRIYAAEAARLNVTLPAG